MDDGMRWIIGGFLTLLGLLGAGAKWVFTQLSMKANKDSTDNRIAELRQDFLSHMKECREDKKDQTAQFDEIKSGIAEISKSVAVLAERNGG